MANLDEGLTLLEEPATQTVAEFEPQERWMAALQQAFEQYAAAPSCDPSNGKQDPFAALLTPFLPLVHWGRRQLDEELSRLPTGDASVDPSSLSPLLTAHSLTQLSQLTVRTVVVEMHAARERGDLVAETPELRFAEFVQQLREPERAFQLLAGYPVLARQATIAVEQWLCASVEFVDRLSRDAAVLSQRYFGGRPLPALVEIEAGAGDRHRGGRSVFVLHWADGSKLLYKPRSLAVEAHFQDLVRWVNARGAQPMLRTLEIIDRGDYGWVEFVERCDVPDSAAMQRFYRRQGAFLALAYLLSATDLHSENLLAAGEHPVLIDLEALFHQHLPGARKIAAARALTNSVLALRMLPQATYVDGFDEPIDFSGLGATAGQATPFRTNLWQNVGRDDMRLESCEVETTGSSHRPRVAGAEVDYRDYKNDLTAGFVETYRLLAAHKAELLAPNGPIEAFAEDSVRFIARPTQVYAILLDQTFHPEALSELADRDRILGRLVRQTGSFACLASLTPHEIDDLNRNDIPVFNSTPAGHELITSTGERIEDFFPESALEVVLDRVSELGESDLARQLWLIDAAFAVAGKRPEPKAILSDPLAEAVNLGDMLLALAQQRGNEVGWIGLHPRGRNWSIGAVGSDLASGQAGIALFLAHLAEATSAGRFGRLARKAAWSVCDRLQWDLEHREAVAQLDEAGRVPHTLAELAQLWQDDRLAGEAARLASRMGLSLPAEGFGGTFAAADRQVAHALAELGENPARMPGIDNPVFAGGLAGDGWRLLRRHYASI